MKNIANWIYNTGLYLVIRDITNYIDWIKTIKSEINNKKSKFNQLGLQRNAFYNVYVAVSLEEADKDLHDTVKRTRVIEMLAPIHRYLDEDLGFAEYIVPEFNQFYDDQNNPTLTYGIVYIFAFKKLTFNWIIKWTALISILTYLFIKFPIISYVEKLIKLF